MRLDRTAVDGVLLDIEGTMTPIAFVYDVLFPFARRHLREFLKEAWHTAPVADAIVRLQLEWADDLAQGHAPPPWASAAGGTVPAADVSIVAAYLEWLMDRDRKSPALKQLQGLVWQRGYASGELVTIVFDDVPEAVRRWTAAGIRVAIYSSGSALAQRELCAHTAHGDLRPLFSGFFDTGVGAKTAPDSYTHIAAALETGAPRMLFVSDVARELDAARAAGCATALCVRPGNAIQPAGFSVDVIHTFEEIAIV